MLLRIKIVGHFLIEVHLDVGGPQVHPVIFAVPRFFKTFVQDFQNLTHRLVHGCQDDKSAVSYIEHAAVSECVEEELADLLYGSFHLISSVNVLHIPVVVHYQADNAIDGPAPFLFEIVCEGVAVEDGSPPFQVKLGILEGEIHHDDGHDTEGIEQYHLGNSFSDDNPHRQDQLVQYQTVPVSLSLQILPVDDQKNVGKQQIDPRQEIEDII